MAAAEVAVPTVSQRVWTSDSTPAAAVDNNNGNETRASTASLNGKNVAALRPAFIKRAGDFVGVQSKFRRKHFNKTIFIFLNIMILLLVLVLVLMAIYYRLYYKNICNTKECVRAATNLLQSMDAAADPCNDFYRFTCGNWAEDHPRPDNAHSNDWFVEKQNRVLRTVRNVLQANGTSDDPKAVGEARNMFKACVDTAKMDALGLQPIIDYLRLFALPTIPRIFNRTLLTGGIEFPKLSPTKTTTESSRSSTTSSSSSTTTKPIVDETFDWIRTVALIRRTLGSDLLVGFDIIPNPTNRSVKMLAFGAPETGSMLPFKNDVEKRLDKIRRRRLNVDETEDDDDDEKETEAETKANEAQQKYMIEVISALIFYADPSINLDELIPTIMTVVAATRRIDKALFKIHEAAENITQPDPHNPLADLVYLNLSALQTVSDRHIAPQSMPIWSHYLNIMFVDQPQMKFTASTPILSSESDLFYLEEFVQLISMLSELELEFHMWWAVVEDLAVHTTSDIRKLHAENLRTITGSDGSGSVSRSFYCTSGVHELLGWAVSYAVVDERFAGETAPKVAQMLENIRQSFDQLVRTATWMDDGTKCATLEKSKAMRSEIGYPEWLTNGTRLDTFYAAVPPMNVSRHLDNMVAVLSWQMAKQLRGLNRSGVGDVGGEEADEEWATPPTTVNAFHTFQENAITIPLSILQFPFYDLGIEALNYGSIGTILGHELTHGFDDSGRMFDKDGNMRQWWSNRTVHEYVNRTSCFVHQYSEYYVKEVAENINGENTLGENIADNGGLREAYMAYQLYVQQTGREMMLPGLENYTSEQLFFMAYGNLWCEIQTTTSLHWAMEDSHCPGRVRLKGVLQNSHEFAEAFGCAANTTMNPPDRCRIW